MQTNPNEAFKQISDLNESLIDFTLRLNKVITQGVAPTMKVQSDSVIAALESAIDHSKKLAEVESPQEVIDEQTALSRDLGENFQSVAHELIKIQQNTEAELKDLLEEGVNRFSPESLDELFTKDS